MPQVSTTLAKLVAIFAAGVINTGGKFAAGVVDTGGNFAGCVVDTSDKLATGVVDTSCVPSLAPQIFEKNLKRS